MPVIVIDQQQQAGALAQALLAGGITTAEITLRTPAALQAIEAMAKSCPDICVGAGTVLNAGQARDAANAGARFAVSPGATEALIDGCAAAGLPLLPGAATVSEMMVLAEKGFTEQKFFPASAGGGVQLLKSVSGPLPGLSFCPTGGITQSTASEWLSLDNVPCLGGSWIAPQQLIAQGDFSAVTQLARAASNL